MIPCSSIMGIRYDTICDHGSWFRRCRVRNNIWNDHRLFDDLQSLHWWI